MLSERKTVPVRSEAHFINYVNTLSFIGRAQTAVTVRARSHQPLLEEAEGENLWEFKNKTPEVLKVCVVFVLGNYG